MQRQQMERCLEQVAAYWASGLKAKAWAEANGVSIRSLASWVRIQEVPALRQRADQKHLASPGFSEDTTRMTDATKQSQASPGGESLPLALPETVAECHLVIETLLQRLAQLHE